MTQTVADWRERSSLTRDEEEFSDAFTREKSSRSELTGGVGFSDGRRVGRVRRMVGRVENGEVGRVESFSSVSDGGDGGSSRSRRRNGVVAVGVRSSVFSVLSLGRRRLVGKNGIS